MTFTKSELKNFAKRVKRTKLRRPIKRTALRNAYRFYNTQRLVTRASK